MTENKKKEPYVESVRKWKKVFKKICRGERGSDTTHTNGKRERDNVT